jgi:hypothetical protein
LEATKIASASASYARQFEEDGGGGDPRARPLDENVSAEQLADEVERIVKENGHWPPRGWVRSATVEQIERRLRLGQKPLLIVDAVNQASKSGIAVGQPIYSFTYFDQPIARAHGEANKRPTLPLDGTGGSHAAQRDAQEFGASVVEQLRRNIPGGG